MTRQERAGAVEPVARPAPARVGRDPHARRGRGRRRAWEALDEGEPGARWAAAAMRAAVEGLK